MKTASFISANHSKNDETRLKNGSLWAGRGAHLFAHGVDVVLEVAVFAKDGDALAGLFVTEPVAVIQLALQGSLQLLQLRSLGLRLLQLPAQ